MSESFDILLKSAIDYNISLEVLEYTKDYENLFYEIAVDSRHDEEVYREKQCEVSCKSCSYHWFC